MTIPSLPRPMQLKQRLAMFDEGWMLFNLFLPAALFFTAMFAYPAGFTEWFFSDDDPFVKGELLAVHEPPPRTRQRGRGDPLFTSPRYYRLDYRYVVAGTTYHDSSYTTNDGLAVAQPDPLPVQYVPGHPGWSRVPGMRAGNGSNWLWLVGVPFIVIGVAVLFVTLRHVVRRICLVRYGVVTKATASRRPMPGVTSRGKPRFMTVLTYQDADSRCHELELDSTGNFNDGAPVRVVCLQTRPTQAVLYDDLPHHVRMLLANRV